VLDAGLHWFADQATIGGRDRFSKSLIGQQYYRTCRPWDGSHGRPGMCTSMPTKKEERGEHGERYFAKLFVGRG